MEEESRTGENETLLVWRDSLLILNLRLHVFDRIRRLNFERDSLSSEGLHEDLHAAAQTQHEMQRRLLLDVVVGKSAAVLELLACNQSTSYRRRYKLQHDRRLGG